MTFGILFKEYISEPIQARNNLAEAKEAHGVRSIIRQLWLQCRKVVVLHEGAGCASDVCPSLPQTKVFLHLWMPYAIACLPLG